MRDGYIKVAAGSVDVSVADPARNTEIILERIRQADAAGVNLLVLPELCVTGYSCGDLFFSEHLLDAALREAERITAATRDRYPVVIFGLPVRYNGKLYNCAAVVANGRYLGLVPKTYLPNYGEFYEKRQFTPGGALGTAPVTIQMPQGNAAADVPFGQGLIFRHETMTEYTFGVEICEDIWAPVTPSQSLCMSGAAIIANLSASDEFIGKAQNRRTLVAATSSKLLCGYVYAGASPTESTQDLVFSGHHLIAESGRILAENKPFENAPLIVSEIDVAHIAYDRRHDTTFETQPATATCTFAQKVRQTALTRQFRKNPFVPPASAQVRERAEMILKIQSFGLAKRLSHTGVRTAVLGISGGLDSTLALLVTARAMDLLSRPRTDIVAVTMPCFGTTKRTKSNAVRLCEELGVTLREVNITAAVQQHFADIGHDPAVTDVTFENSQARERTQVLMDIANQTGGMVIGTGDLSELALGWATYNGDHMSMYGVNASIPKTLVRYIVRYEADIAEEPLSTVLLDILDTPVSPELLPTDEHGEMVQKTEDLVGPYELHDFFLYQMLRFGTRPRKIFRLAHLAFAGEYDDETILKWLTVFTRRFFNQQFKRSCLPDGPKVGSVTLSPRGDWRMPSDASARLWLEEIEECRAEYLATPGK